LNYKVYQVKLTTHQSISIRSN